MSAQIERRDAALAELALPDRGIGRFAALALLAVAGSLVLWASAKVQVPFYPVPMTLQTMVIVLIGACYGLRLGVATILLYLAQGAAGLPVFVSTPERGLGLFYMMGPTAGYLLGFIAAVALVGWCVDRGAARSLPLMFGAMLAGAALILVMGASYLGLLFGPEIAWNSGVAPFVIGDLVKVGLAALLMTAAGRAVRHR